MKLLAFNLLYLFVLGTIPLLAQISAFISVGHGYYSNPLYNYQHKGDQLQNGYGELNFVSQDTSSLFDVHYAGGLTLFNQQFARTYYEHSLSSRYLITWNTPSAKKNPNIKTIQIFEPDVHEKIIQDSPTMTETDQSNIALEENDDFDAIADTTGRYFSSKVVISNRMDRYDFHRYNNWSLSAECVYKLPVGESYFLKVIEQPMYRSYPYQNELSHIANSLTVQLRIPFSTHYEAGFSLTPGVRYYTIATMSDPDYNVDSTVNSLGGVPIITYDSTIVGYPKDSTRTITQVVLQGYFSKEWENGNIWSAITYRINPKKSVRQFLPDSTFSSLTEDLYNEEFGFEGAAVTIQVNQIIEHFAKCIFTISASQKKYTYDAYDIRGNEKREKRYDISWECDTYCSHYFPITPNFGIETYIAAQYVRNQSNDDYNDFFGLSFSAGVGIGF